MRLENQVINENNAAMLKTLGVIQKSLFYHHPAFDSPVFGETVTTEWGKQYKKTQGCNDKKASLSAFTVSELGVIIGKGTKSAELLHNAIIDRINGGNSITLFLSPDFVANALIGMLQTERVSAEECNKRLLES